MKQILLAILSLLSLNISAQQFHRCATDEYMHSKYESNSNLQLQVEDMFQAAKMYAESKGSNKALGDWDTIFRIPLVFHIVHNTNEENLDDSLIYSQLDVLNEDFRRLNADTNNTRAIFQDRAGDAGFEFYLATVDPDGNPTTGITRTQTSVNQFSFFNLDDIKTDNTGGKDAWPTDKYVNVWIGDYGGLVLGFAYPPLNAPNWPAGQTPMDESVWGIAMHYEVVGRNNPLAVGPLSIADKGRTLVHEMGHYWGLRHIWGDAGGIFGGVDCDATADDGIADTPHAGNNSQADGCDFSKNSCVFETPDEPDMVENYMDYSTETCQNTFTDGQIQIIRSMAIIGRPGLAFILSDDTFVPAIGEYIIVNGTDTIFLDGSDYSITVGDQVLFVNENNGYNYTATESFTFSSGDSLTVTENGDLSFGGAVSTSVSYTNTISVSLFPNPATNIVKAKLDDTELDEIKVFSIDGKLILQEVNIENVTILNLHNAESGIYYIQFLKDGRSLSSSKVTLLK